MAEIVLHEYPEFRERYYEIKRAGLPAIYLIPKKRSTFYATLRVGVGSYDRFFSDHDRLVRVTPGSAHFLEHKLFANPDGSDAMETMRDLGADANAYTTGTSTCYLFSCRENFAASLCELLSFVSTPCFTMENVESEKRIILQEAAMHADSPSTRLYRGFLRQLYRDHPIRDEIVGTPGSISRITPSHLLRVYRAFYHADNMQLFIAGDLSPDDVLSALESVSLPASSEFRRVPPTPESGRCVPAVRIYRGRVNKPLFAVSIGIPEPIGSPEERHRRMLAVSIGNAHLFSDSGALYTALREGNLLTAPPNCYAEWNPGVSYISVTGESARPKRVYDMIREAVDKMLVRGIESDDVLRLSRAEYAEDVSTFDDAEGLTDAFATLIPEGIDPYRAAGLFKTLSPDYVNSVLREVWSTDRLILTSIRPDKRNFTESEDEE
ncbi:MAG: insulinase family protein [Clostridia bacterium]|nr:insulinase family protein [Clostridia bacterium]